MWIRDQVSMKTRFWDQVIFWVVAGPILVVWAYAFFKLLTWLQNLGRHAPTVKASEVSKVCERSPIKNPMQIARPNVPLRSASSIIFWYDLGSRILCLILPFVAPGLLFYTLSFLPIPAMKKAVATPPQGLSVEAWERRKPKIFWFGLVWTVTAVWRAAHILSVVSKGIVIRGRVVSGQELKGGVGRMEIEYEFAGHIYHRAISALTPIDEAAKDLLLYIDPRKPRRCFIAAIYPLVSEKRRQPRRRSRQRPVGRTRRRT
jgi:hypothetical protein